MNKEKKQFAFANCYFFIEICVEFPSVCDKMMKM